MLQRWTTSIFPLNASRNDLPAARNLSSPREQNAEAAAVKRLDLLLDAQRRQAAHHAGEHWKPLFDYLSGKLRALPEG